MKNIVQFISDPAGIQYLMICTTAFIAILFAFGLLSFRNPIHAALCLIGNFVCLAAIYVMMGSFLMGVVQLVVYAGAIMVLFLFVIMFFFTPSIKSKYETNPMKNIIMYGVALGLVLFGLITGFFWASNTKVGIKTASSQSKRTVNFNIIKGPRNSFVQLDNVKVDDPAQIESKGGPLVVTGFDLLNKNIVAFELISLLLLTAIIGSVVLIKYLSESPDLNGKELNT